ncbi:hypothetical protein M2343_003067 [Sphingobium sp. B8D3B]|nr:hypothetical protein [Sphingobium sp. B8D3B]
MFEFGEEALDQIALTIEPLAEARLPLSIGFGRDIGRGALFLDQRADAISIVGFVGEHDRVGLKLVEQIVRDLAIMCLPSGQAEPDREALRINDRVDFGREPASGATETMISIPLFAVAACWWARTDVLSIIWMSP